MPELLPLAEASKRLRKPAGRPRKAGSLINQTTSAVAPQASAPPAAPPSMRVAARPVAEVWPRLLGLASAAAYLSLSVWTLREYLAVGILTRVDLPSATHGTTRRVLLDRVDLDALVETSRAGAEAARKAP